MSVFTVGETHTTEGAGPALLLARTLINGSLLWTLGPSTEALGRLFLTDPDGRNARGVDSTSTPAPQLNIRPRVRTVRRWVALYEMRYFHQTRIFQSESEAREYASRFAGRCKLVGEPRCVEWEIPA